MIEEKLRWIPQAKLDNESAVQQACWGPPGLNALDGRYFLAEAIKWSLLQCAQTMQYNKSVSKKWRICF